MIHKTAIIEDYYAIGNGTKIWAFAHICKGAVIGENCNIGEGVYIGPGVIIGDRCKIQNHCLIYKGVTIGDEVFLGPCVITTNDNFPRAVGDWSDRFKETRIEHGVSVCANSTIVCGITLGKGAMIGAGSVVTQDIKPGYIAYGNPAKHVRKICECA